jgi:hypothetical protein
VAWTGLLALAPFLASRAHASAAATGIVLAVYAVGSIVCHQLPARSFHVWTAQLPVCARCTGIYVGAAAAAVVAALAPGGTTDRTEATAAPIAVARPRIVRHRILLALAAAPTLATLAFEWTTGRTPSNEIRCAAGIPLGAAAAWLIVAASRNQVN